MKISIRKVLLAGIVFFACAGSVPAGAKTTTPKPVVSVNANQIKLGSITSSWQEQEVKIQQVLENKSNGKIKKIVAKYSYQWALAEEQPASAGAVSLGEPVWKEQSIITMMGSSTAKGKKILLHSAFRAPDGFRIQGIKDIKLVELRIYSKTGVVIINKETGKTHTDWGTKDTKAPVITGIVGAKAYNKHYKDVCRTIYKGEEKWLLKAVSAYDNRDGKVKVTVDTSRVKWNKKGVYTVIYQAKDKAGNVAKVKTKVQVRRKGDDLDRYANSVLKRIVKSSWSDTKKARAIYRYVRSKMAYVDSNVHASWQKSALSSLRYKSGNCFCYYSLSRLLLTRCGIINQTVTRYRGHGHHWWNYVYVQGGWYHFDTTPRRVRGKFCLKTGKQLTAYSKRAGNSHIWNPKWIPAGAKKKI